MWGHHEWIIQFCWFSSRRRKNDYISWFPPASQQSMVQLRRIMLSSQSRDSHDNGPLLYSVVWAANSLWFLWSVSGNTAQTETVAPEQTIASHPILSPLLSGPSCLALGVKRRMSLSVFSLLFTFLGPMRPWQVLVCSASPLPHPLMGMVVCMTLSRPMVPITESYAEWRLKMSILFCFSRLWTFFSFHSKE